MRWEYKVASLPPSKSQRDAHVALLNSLGSDGWELVTVADPGESGWVAWFKRPVAIGDGPYR